MPMIHVFASSDSISRNEIQPVHQTKFPPRSELPLTVALRHGYQVILLLRRARRDAQGPAQVEAINNLISAQQAVCSAIEGLRVGGPVTPADHVTQRARILAAERDPD